MLRPMTHHDLLNLSIDFDAITLDAQKVGNQVRRSIIMVEFMAT